MSFVAVVESSVAGQRGHGAFDAPAAPAESIAGLDALPDTDSNVLAPWPFPQMGDVVGFVRVKALGLGLGCVGFVSHVEMRQHRLRRLAVVGVGRGDSDA